VNTTLARRLGKLEADQRAANQERHDAGMRELGRTMAPEHIAFIQDWMEEHCGGPILRVPPGESVYETLERLNPPALVRAAWLMLDAHVRDGRPVSLAPEIAEVYLTDQRAWPVGSCEGCDYPLPIQGTVHPDGTFSDVGWYTGTCPACGLSNDPDDKEGEAV
jgi:hypothetical protein